MFHAGFCCLAGFESIERVISLERDVAYLTSGIEGRRKGIIVVALFVEQYEALVGHLHS